MSGVWENKLLKYDLGWKGFDYDRIERDLNSFGREGWEAIQSIIPSIGTGHTPEVIIIIKRPANA